MEKIKIVALYGKSSVGKDTIQKWIVSNYPQQTHGIISCTTRPPRDYEENGKDYYFLSKQEFTEKIDNGSMLETTHFREWFYGTALKSLDKNKINIGVFNVTGLETLLNDKRLEVYPVLVFVPNKIRLLRSLNREKNPDCTEICRRYLADEQDFCNLKFQPIYTWDNYDDSKPANERYQKHFTTLLDKISL